MDVSFALTSSTAQPIIMPLSCSALIIERESVAEGSPSLVCSFTCHSSKWPSSEISQAGVDPSSQSRQSSGHILVGTAMGTIAQTVACVAKMCLLVLSIFDRDILDRNELGKLFRTIACDLAGKNKAVAEYLGRRTRPY